MQKPATLLHIDPAAKPARSAAGQCMRGDDPVAVIARRQATEVFDGDTACLLLAWRHLCSQI